MKNNIEFERNVLTIILMLIAGALIIFIITEIKARTTKYEYYINGYYGKSTKCYVDKNEDLKCQVGNYLISVDEYYIAK